MMGYSDELKSYRLFNPIKKLFILSHDVFFDETISGNQLLNSSPSPLNSDPFDILEESGLIVFVFGVSTGPTSSPESPSGHSNMTVEVGSSTLLTNEIHLSHRRIPCLGGLLRQLKLLE